MNKRADFRAAPSLKQSAFWMPYTANRQFKAAPRLLARAEGMYYWTADGRQILDGQADLDRGNPDEPIAALGVAWRVCSSRWGAGDRIPSPDPLEARPWMKSESESWCTCATTASRSGLG